MNKPIGLFRTAGSACLDVSWLMQCGYYFSLIWTPKCYIVHMCRGNLLVTVARLVLRRTVWVSTVHATISTSWFIYKTKELCCVVMVRCKFLFSPMAWLVFLSRFVADILVQPPSFWMSCKCSLLDRRPYLNVPPEATWQWSCMIWTRPMIRPNSFSTLCRASTNTSLGVVS